MSKRTILRKVCVYCASSSQLDSIYINAAKELGKLLAQNNIEIVYGAGSVGLMGNLANSALENGGKVTGVIPKFMVELEWAHKGITDLKIFESMPERKNLLIDGTDAVIALPGGSGTLEELLEVISLKRLGIYLNPIVILNTGGYFDPLIEQLNRCIEHRFMDTKHKSMWVVIKQPEGLFKAIEDSPKWSPESINFAGV